MTLAALILLLPGCSDLPLHHREALAGSALVAEAVSGIPARDWIALSWAESHCGQHRDNLEGSSAVGPWQVIPRWSPLSKWMPLHWWPVNAAAAAENVRKLWKRRCGRRWPACHNHGTPGLSEKDNKVQMDFERAQRILRRGERRGQ
jgi:hypothetical protein